MRERGVRQAAEAISPLAGRSDPTSKRFTFTRDGKFTTENLASTTAPNVAAFSKKNTAGKYKINGHVIELTFNSGDSRRLFFCFYGKDKRVLRIAGNNYTPANSSRRNR